MKKKLIALVSALVLTGSMTACNPTTSTNASNSSNSSQAVATGAANGSQGASANGSNGQSPAVPSDVAIATNTIDPNIVLAEGDGVKVTSGDVQKEYDRMVSSFVAQFGAEEVNKGLPQLETRTKDILTSLVNNQVMAHHADVLKIPKVTEEGRKEFDRIRKENIARFGSEQGFAEAVKKAGYTLPEYEQEIYKALRIKAVGDHLTKDVTVTDAEVKDYYDKNKASFMRPAGAKFAHILLSNDDAGKKKAEELKKQLDGGADFAKLAKENSKDPGSAVNGGELGYYAYNNQELVKEFTEAGKKLKEGQISAPVKSQFGYHLIKATQVTPKEVQIPLTEKTTLPDGKTVTTADLIKENLIQPKRQEKLKTVMPQLMANYKVKVFQDKLPQFSKVVNPPETTKPAATTPGATTAAPATTTAAPATKAN